MVKNIKVRFIEKTTKAGNKFLVGKAQKIDGNWEPIKFRKEVTIPKIAGVYIMEVETENMQKSFNDYGVVWWVQNEANFKPFVAPDEAQDEF